MKNTNVENMKNEVLAKYEELETAFEAQATNEVLDQIQAEIAELNKAINEALFPKEETTIEKIANQLFEQGFYSKEEEGTLTVTGMEYDLSIVVLEKGFALETFSTHEIEHFNNNEWANYKEVKTTRGLNGYLKKFGFGTVEL